MFDLVDDVAARQPSCQVEPTFTGLGRDHHIVASADEGAAEALLAGFAFNDWCRPGQRRGRERLAQWTGTATSSTASASGTAIGFGRR